MTKERLHRKLHPNPENPFDPGAPLTAEEAAATWSVEATGMMEDRQVRLHMPLYGAQSFTEVEERTAEDFAAKRIERLNIYFMLILGNIVSNPDIDIDEIAIRLHAAIAEYARRLGNLTDDNAPANAEDEVAIIPAAQKETKVKAPIKREAGIDRPARDYAYVPDPALPATWALPLTDAPGAVSLSKLGLAAAAISPGGSHGVRVKIPTSALSAVKRRILSEYRTLKVPEEKIPVSIKESKMGGQFTLWKEKGGSRYRWMAVYSNNFIDRDTPPEIISEKSHKTFVQMVDEGIVDYPELWHWHIPGTAWGKADMLDYVDGFALAVGYVYPGHEKEAEALMGRKDLGVSHGMPFATLLYDPQNTGVIDFHVTREISVLPHHAVANPLTDFVVLGNPEENSMGISTAKREWLISDLGLDEERVKGLERNLKDMGELARSVGIQSKAAVDEDEEEYEDEESDEEEYDESDEDEEEDEGVEYDEEESDEEDVEKARSSRRPRVRDKPSSFAGRPQSGSSGSRGSKKRGGLWTGAKREKPSSFAGRPQSGSSGGRGKKKPSSFAARKKKEAGVEATYVTREEVADVLAEVLNPIMDSLASMGQVLAQYGEVVKALSDTDSDKIARTRETTPTLSLSEILRERIPIGRKEAQVDGRTQLAKEGPQEVKQQAPAYTPSSFVNGLVHAATNGPAQQAQ